jgi:glycosyltransferase involved in cell wall biosynthesis
MGAPQSRLLETAIGLKNNGWKVIVITALPNYPTGKIFRHYKKRFFTKETFNEIQVWRYLLYSSNSKKSVPRILSMLSFSLIVLFSLFKVKKFKPDYIFTESPPLTLGVSGLLLAKFSRSKHILNVSDLWPLSAFELGAISNGFLYKKLEALESFLYKKSFACTGQSQEIINCVAKKGATRTLLFRNGVDTSRFPLLNDTDFKGSHLKIRIVYAGLLGIAQGIFELCKNIDFDAVNCEFHIYGQGSEKKHIALFLSRNSNKGIYLHEPIERNLIPETLVSFDATIIPLIKPIFGAVPSKIYEAMAAGLPIIFSGGGEGATIIKKYDLGWICNPSDFNDIKSVLLKLSEMPINELIERRKRAITIASKVFDRKIQIGNLNDFLINELN